MKPANPAPAKTPLRRSPWPYAIIGWFVLFITGMATWTVVAVRQDIDLVRPDYYEEEIRYQRQIDRLIRTSALKSDVSVAHDSRLQQIELRLPASHASSPVEGRIRFYRPSDAGLDFELPLAVSADGLQRVPVGGLRTGLWKVQIHWKHAGEEFYFDRSIVL